MNPAGYPSTTPAQSRSNAKPAPPYSAFVPILMILVILILSSLKDVVSLIKHKRALQVQHAQAMEPLRFAGRQSGFIDSLHQDLVKVAPSDPAAAAILAEFFSAPAAPPTPDQPNSNADPQNQEAPR